MTDENKKVIQAMLGINQPRTAVQNASTVIGGLLFGGGLIGALNANNQTKSYNQATKSEQLRIGEIGPAFEASANETKAGLASDLGAYQAKTEAGVKQGLINRGITDPAIGEQAAGAVKAVLSGAYAQAHSALALAKFRAGSAVSGALSAYQQQLAQKQYESMMAKYYQKMGLWSALGGGVSSLMSGIESTPMLKPVNEFGAPGMDEKGGK